MDRRLCDSDFNFLSIIWEHEPLSSMELVELCAGKLGWKKSTVFTMLRKLEDKGLVRNENRRVSSLVTRAQVTHEESARFVEKTFGGSLPGFLVAFMDGRKLSDREADELLRLIEEHRED